MSTLLTVLACLTAYATAGAVYARAMFLTSYRRSKASHSGSRTYAREDAMTASLLRVAFWPLFIPYDALRGQLTAWLTAPLDDRKARAEQLRKDAQAWRAKQYDGTPAERAMADELAHMCDERAKEVDL